MFLPLLGCWWPPTMRMSRAALLAIKAVAAPVIDSFLFPLPRAALRPEHTRWKRHRPQRDRGHRGEFDCFFTSFYGLLLFLGHKVTPGHVSLSRRGHHSPTSSLQKVATNPSCPKVQKITGWTKTAMTRRMTNPHQGNLSRPGQRVSVFHFSPSRR